VCPLRRNPLAFLLFGGILVNGRINQPEHCMPKRANGKIRGVVMQSRVRLLEVDPDLGRLLSPEELAEVRQLTVPVVKLAREEADDVCESVARNGAFAALVLRGMVFRRLTVSDQLGMTLLGQGDILTVNDGMPSMLVGESSARASPDTELALLGRDVLLAARRWPTLVSGLQVRAAQQADRLTTQLVICQLPRVDQRLLALMWLLAESWGRVTPSGTRLPLKLTHDALGALIGARRPTVTLALRELTERGAIVRQDQGWLLLEAPPGASEPGETFRAPTVLEAGPTSWAQPRPEAPAEDLAETYDLLRERIAALREQHSENRSKFSQRLQAVASVRDRCRESRNRIARDRLTRLRSRSS
jgi:CRP/FNR family transcriptional regulator, cyclic AMP receptor protein